MSEEDVKRAIVMILSRHIGKEKAIGMGELYYQVYRKTWRHRINDTRELRQEIKGLRYQGVLIGETRSRTGGGYYLARSTYELEDWFRRRKREALKKLDMIAKMKNIGLPELLGQMQLGLTTGHAKSKEHGAGGV
jgi:hypothetical protein